MYVRFSVNVRKNIHAKKTRLLFYFCARAFQKRKNAVKMRRISGDHFRRICPACRNPAEDHRPEKTDHERSQQEDRKTGNRLERIKPEQITGKKRTGKRSNISPPQPPPLISCGREKAGKAVEKTPTKSNASIKKARSEKPERAIFWICCNE